MEGLFTQQMHVMAISAKWPGIELKMHQQNQITPKMNEGHDNRGESAQKADLHHASRRLTLLLCACDLHPPDACFGMRFMDIDGCFANLGGDSNLGHKHIQRRANTLSPNKQLTIQ